MSNKPTDAQQFIDDIGAGVFGKQLGVAVSEVANSVLATSKVGEINIKLKVSKISDSQVQIESKLQFNEPLAKGKRVEEHNEKTPMYVNLGGDVSLFAKNSLSLLEEEA
ncbi:hypothetical protein [Acinetobacter sp. Ac_5812]|uniref:hypothetical protein n=1 Tax=Acinetobacter sp. Ac_5812 TaxID=1848937 RepID=UPI0014906BCD|nr:hypothetical protein [Acinetobacter sp. Ac_5812]NNP70442.1 hypothetical protein [Acinetobacter sp. Ac_5812]